MLVARVSQWWFNSGEVDTYMNEQETDVEGWCHT